MDKEEKYNQLLKILDSLYDGEPNLIANLANTTAVLKEYFGHLWVGFYLVDSTSNELVLGPFQGPLACTRISYGRGVCGASWEQKQALIVPDVHRFPGHIACSAMANSEIVIPILKNDVCLGVLDIDSDQKDSFNAVDLNGLTKLCQKLSLIF